MVRLTDDQQEAVERAEQWWQQARQQAWPSPFRLDGYAGTGKTFVVESLVAQLGISPDNVLAMAPTGKAARVLALRTGWPTSTIHRALYTPVEDAKVLRARARLDEAERRGDPGARDEARRELAEAEREAELGFSRNGSSLDDYHLLVVDEHSMVDERVANDLLGLGKPIVLLGDPGQLPPVKGRSGFENLEPAKTLTEIMRQDEGSDILLAANAARRGEDVQTSYGGTGFRMVRPKTLTSEDYAGFDIVLCGTHKVRRGFNRRMRGVLGHVQDRPTPGHGEQLVVRRNDYRLGVFNGQIVTAETAAEPLDFDTAEIQIRDDLDNVIDTTINTLRVRQHVENVDVHSIRGALDIDLAYCLTVHSAQGSEWDNVCVIDDWPGNQHDRWLYTALTRGSKNVTLVSRDAC